MNCDVIKDLMPLYIENLTSESSNDLIENHIKNCKDCKQTLSNFQEDIIIDNKAVQFDKVENPPNILIKRIQKNIYEKILRAVLITLILGIVIGICSSKIFRAMAFLGSTSIISFATAIFVSILICRRKYSWRQQFKVLGNWVFVLSIGFSGLLFLLFREYFNESDNIIIIISLEILYNIILSLTLRIYARFKLSKADSADAEKLTNKKLFMVTFTTLIFIITIIAVPVTLLERNRIVDNINLSFVNDSDVIGKWTTVDFVSSPDKFHPNKQLWRGNLYLNEMTFLENGQIKGKFDKVEEGGPGILWTKGYVIHKRDHTLSKYDIREINGSLYMFFEWKSGDYAYFHKHPKYYVLKKEAKKQ